MESVSEYISLAEATRLAPGRPHSSAVWRWCRKGIKTRRGDRVHLEHIRAGGRIFTTENWLIEFFKAIAEADVEYFASRNESNVRTLHPASGQRQNAVVRSPKQRRDLMRRESKYESSPLRSSHAMAVFLSALSKRCVPRRFSSTTFISTDSPS